MYFTLVLDNIRSTYNVGAILRTFEGFGGARNGKVVFSGVTPCGYVGQGENRVLRAGVLPHIAEKIDRQIAKTALGAERMVFTEFSEDILGFLESKKREGAVIIGLENNISDNRVLPLSEIPEALERLLEAQSAKKTPGAGQGTERSEAIIILGEEVSGISEEIRGVCDFFAEIPMRGQKESFNVSVAAGILLYELMGVQYR